MKKIISFLLVSLFIFTFSSCTIKINTPEIPQSFNQNAVVTSGDFSFECEICKNEEIVSVKVKNTNALGLIMIYDGNTVNFKYDEYSKKISGENFEKGKTNFGEFVLVQNDNSTLKFLSFKNSDYRIDFK